MRLPCVGSIDAVYVRVSPSLSDPVNDDTRGVSSLIVYPVHTTVGGVFAIVTTTVTVPVFERAPL